MNNFGVVTRGIKLPIITGGDDISQIICDELNNVVSNNNLSFSNNDIIAITESLIARAYRNYVTVDDIVFNIPEGFEYNETMTNLTYLLTDDEFKNNNGDVKIYSSDSDNITIMVSDSKEAKISNLYSNGYDSKTVNGQKGAIKYMTDMEYYMYVFKKDDKLAVVYVTDDALLEDIIT